MMESTNAGSRDAEQNGPTKLDGTFSAGRCDGCGAQSHKLSAAPAEFEGEQWCDNCCEDWRTL